MANSTETPAQTTTRNQTAVMNTSNIGIEIPKEMLPGIFQKISAASVVAGLSSSTPMTFGDVNNLVFSSKPKAEFVGEGEAKNPSKATFSNIVGAPHKAQVTVRMSNELEWADEDGRVAIIDAITDSMSEACGQALDYGIIHGVSPATGAAVTGMSHITNECDTITKTAKVEEDLDSLVAKVVENGYLPSALALDPAEAVEVYKARSSNRVKVFPDFTLAQNAQNTLAGLPSLTSANVGGKGVATADTNLLALAGDFTALRWGIVRNLGIEVIRYGDPDGQGDLKRYNQVAYRAEMVFTWAILDSKAFVALKSA